MSLAQSVNELEAAYLLGYFMRRLGVETITITRAEMVNTPHQSTIYREDGIDGSITFRMIERRTGTEQETVKPPLAD